MVAITVATNVTVRTGAQGIPGIPGTAAPHAVDHEAGGDDEVTIEDLVTTGTLGQVPTATASNTMVMSSAVPIHLADTSNPHSVTAVQAGAEPAGSIATHASDADAHHSQAHTLASHSDTATTGAALDAHISSTANPHSVSAAQAGAEAAGSIATHAALSDAHHPQAHTIVSHSDTTATGAELDELTDGSETTLHSHAAGVGDVTSPGGETAGRITKFTGSKAVAQTATTETQLATAVTHSGIVTGNPHALDATDVSAEPAGAIATHTALGDAHHAESHTIASHSDTSSTGAELDTAVTHSGIVTGNPHSLDATDVGAEPAGAIATHTALGDAHHAESHTLASHSDVATTGAALDAHIADVTGNPHAVTATQAGAEPVGSIATHAALANAHHNESHASTHSDGGSDEVNVEDLASTGADGQVVASDGAGALVLSNGMIQNSKTGMVDVLTNLISINSDPAKVDIRASQGVVINFDPDPTSPTVVPLVWAVPFEAITLPGLAANLVTAVFVVDSGGGVPVIELSNVFPTPEDTRTKLLVGFAFHAGSSVVDAVASAGVTAFDTGSSLDDLMSAIGDFNLSGNIYSANGVNLLLDKGLGESFGRGLNPAEINNQHHLINALQSGITAYDYSYRDAGSGFNTSLESTIDPNFYDDGSGTLAATSNKYTIQRLVFTPRGGGLTAVEYGQKLYNSLNDAIDGISANGIIKNPDFSSAILRGWLVVQGNTTDLTNVADAAFRENHFEIAQPSGAGTDVNAIHVDGSNEISGITPKTALVAGDLLVIEDSAAGNIKKSVALSSLDARYAELAGATFSGVVNMGGNEILDVSFLGITDSGTPRLVLTETSADLDEKLWGISNNVGNYRLEAIDDAFGSVTLALGFQRTGMVLDLCTIGSDLTVQGEVTASEPTTSTSLTTRGFVEALVQGIDWQQSVISDVLATPPAHVEGARYLIPAGATGDWSGNVDDITQSVSSAWVFTTAVEGMTVPVNNIGRTRRFTSSVWISLGSTIDHANTIGLTTGDAGHTQLQLRSEKGSASGYVGLTAGSKISNGAFQVYGTGANTACEGNDSRLSDARTPTAHSIASHDDTSATGAEMDALTDGSDVSTGHLHSQYAELAGATFTGAISVVHTSTEDDDFSLRVIADAAGFSDVKAIDVTYITGAIGPGDDEEVFLANIDQSASTGGRVVAFEALATTTGAAEVDALEVGAGVHPVRQISGAFGDLNSLLVIAVDQLTALSQGGGGNISIFVADNDTMTFGDVEKFEELEFILDTVASGSGIAPVFEYSTGVGTWAVFGPADGTSGMRSTGIVAWLLLDIPSWAVGTGSEFLIRITRTRNSLGTTPIADLVQREVGTSFSWTKDGNLEILGVQFADKAAPANPGDGLGELYKKSGDDGIFWKPDAAGAEVDLTDHAPSGTAAGSLTGSYPNPGVADGADGTAIHDNVSGEISALTDKATPVGGDFLLIEDSAASNAKKRINISNLPVPAPVFGSEYVSITTTSTTQNNTSTYVSHLRLPASGTITFPSGLYRLEIQYVWEDNAGHNSRVEEDGVLVGIEHLVGASNGNDVVQVILENRTLNGAHEFDLLVKSSTGPARLKTSTLTVWRIS